MREGIHDNVKDEKNAGSIQDSYKQVSPVAGLGLLVESLVGFINNQLPFHSISCW
jgi:hypothetical protein